MPPRPPQPILSSITNPKIKPQTQFSSLPKIAFPVPYTVGTDIVYVPRIYEILRGKGGKGRAKGQTWGFVKRILGEEELVGFEGRFGERLGRWEGLCASEGWVKGLDLKGGLSLRGGGEDGMVEGRRQDTKEGEGIIEELLGKGFWDMVWTSQKGRTLDKMDKEERLSKEGVVMAVLKRVVEWKVLNAREEIRTPWAVLMDGLKKGGSVQDVTGEVVNAMRVSIGGVEDPREENLLYELDRPDVVHTSTTGDKILDPDTNSEQNSELAASEAEAALFANLTASRAFNIKNPSGSQNPTTTPFPTRKLDTRSKDPIETKPTTDLLTPSSTPSPNQEDTTLFHALFTSLLTSLHHAERDLQTPAIFLAGRFAAKEAIMKAHHSRRLTYHDIVILAQPSDENGSRPPVGYVLSEGEAREVRFSISHHEDYAIATAMVVEGEENNGGNNDGRVV